MSIHPHTSDSVILGIICTVADPLMFLSPIMLYIEMIQTRQTYKVPYMYFFFNFIQNIFWICFAHIVHDVPILVTAILTMIFFGFFLFSYILITNKPMVIKIMQVVLILLVSSITFYISYEYLSADTLGIIGLVFESIAFASTLQYVHEILKYQDPTYIDIWITLSIFICTTLWVIYSGVTRNVLWMIPNLVGAVSSLFLLIVFFLFTYKRMKFEDSLSGEIKRRKEMLYAE